MFSWVAKRKDFVRYELNFVEVWSLTNYFAIPRSQNMSVGVSQVHKMRQTTNF